MAPRASATATKPEKASATAAAKDDARAKALAAFMGQQNRKKPGTVFTFNSKERVKVDVVPTGALSLDYALGVGGLPRGRITEIYGPESNGKTSLALSVCAQAVKAGGLAAIIDAEHAISDSHIIGMGGDPDYIAVSQPDSGEDAMQLLSDMIDADIYDVIVVDSVAALVPEAELKGEMGDVTVGAQARLMSQSLRRVNPRLGKSKAVVIFINQLREKIGVMFGSPETTPGGRSLKFYASVRLSVTAPAGQRIKDPKDKNAFIGLGTNVRVVKNKVAPPQKKAEYELIWGKGINFPASVFEVAKEIGVLSEAGGNAWAIAATGEVLSDADGKAVRGKDNIKALLTAQPELAQKIADLCYMRMSEGIEEYVPEEEDPVPDDSFLPDDADVA